MERAHGTAALDQRDNGPLLANVLSELVRAALALLGNAGLIDRPVVRLVNLYDLAWATHGRHIEAATAHCLHHAMVEEPSGVVLTAKVAMQLHRREAVLGRGIQVE